MRFNAQQYRRMTLPEKIAYLKRLIAELNKRLAILPVGTDRRRQRG